MHGGIYLVRRLLFIVTTNNRVVLMTTNRRLSVERNKLESFGAFRLSPIAAAIAALSVIASVPVYASDANSVDALKAEIVRLKQELEAARGGSSVSAPVVGSESASAAPPAVEETEVPQGKRSMNPILPRLARL